jgi:hypothetical protein
MCSYDWIPAFGGMTVGHFSVLSDVIPGLR